MKTPQSAADSFALGTRRRGACGVLGLAAAAGLCSSAGAQVLANAHDDFSAVQGYNGWYYGFFDGNSATPWSLADFEGFTIFDTTWHRTMGPGGYWTMVGRDGGHPNGLITSGGRIAEDNWAVRRWISDGEYVLNVFGRVWDSNPTLQLGNGNGVIGYVMVDGVTIWQGIIDAGNQHGLEYDLQFCAVPGTTVDFVIDPRESNDWSDDTGFHSTIRTIIDHQPQDAMTCTGGTVEFQVITIPGDYTYQWRRNGDPIMHDGDMARLMVVNAGSPALGIYDCVVTSACGSMVSDPALLTICDADFDCDGMIDSSDFFSFLNAFFSDDPRTDFNADGSINSQDFFDFLNHFFAGC
jgi:hypothetical protein